jgi:hypothetical protein
LPSGKILYLKRGNLKMKKYLTVFAALLALGLVLAVVAPVMAEAAPTPAVVPDPVVAVLSGDANFTTHFLSIAALPGTSGADAFNPAGWPAGEKQFEGKGIKLSGLSYGSVSVCFPLQYTSQGWTGAVASYNGTKWELLSTTLTPLEESQTAMACAAVSANGTYALLKWVGNRSLLPKTDAVTPATACDFGWEYVYKSNYDYYMGELLGGKAYLGLQLPEKIAGGTPVTYEITEVDPSWTGTILGGMTGSTTVGDLVDNAAYFTEDAISFSKYPTPVLTVRLSFPTLNCYLDLNYPSLNIPK